MLCYVIIIIKGHFINLTDPDLEVGGRSGAARSSEQSGNTHTNHTCLGLV